MTVCGGCGAQLDDVDRAAGRCSACGGDLDGSEGADSLLGRELDGRFAIESAIGAGGMGTVYKATQLAMGRPVAVKVLLPYYATRPRSVRRFVKEARAASRLNHPNIITLYDFGQSAEGYLYIVMELLHGSPLTDLLAQGPLPLWRAVVLLDQVCAALVEAHAAGVIHCDLKPDNIFVSARTDAADAVKVLDFGIARVISADGGSSSGGVSREVCGTPDYMAPERILGRTCGRETDLYSLGVVLYEVLAGRRPYAAPNPMQVCLRHLNDPIPQLPPTLPADGTPSGPVQALLDQLMAKNQADRMLRIDEVRAALRALVPAGALGAAPGPWSMAAPAGGPGAPPGATAGDPADPPPAPVRGSEAPTVTDPEPDAGALPTQVRCERCGSFNAGHWAFCGTCGAAMDDQPPCPGCKAPMAADALFCPRCGYQVAPERRPSPPVAPTLVGAEPEARRVVTAVQALVTLDPADGQELDLEDRLELLRPLLVRWSEAVRVAGGAVHGESGQGLCAIFGVPATGAADALVAMRCALALRDEGERFSGSIPGRLTVRCGVSMGAALVRRRGVDGDWSVKGDVVVEAALLAGDAPAGEALCSDAAWQEVRDAIDAAPASPDGSGGARWVVRGLRQAIGKDGAPGSSGDETPLIGRETELATLQGRVLSTVHNNSPHLVTIVGPTGVGKSRLVRELLSWVRATLPESVVIEGRAMRHGVQPPYQLFRDALSGAAAPAEGGDEVAAIAAWLGARTVRSVSAPLLGLLGLDVPADVDPVQVHQRGLVAAGHVVQSIARGGPLIFVVDHLHAADDASVDLLSSLLERVTDTPFLVIGCACPELYEARPAWGVGRPDHTRLDLRPLPTAASVRLVETLLQRAQVLPASVRELVVQRSEGNPYFAEEIVRLFLQRGVVVPQDDGTWLVEPGRLDEAAVPRSIEALLHARVDVLSGDDRVVLGAAAIVGHVFWRGAVNELVPKPLQRGLDTLLTGLCRAGLIRKRRKTHMPQETEFRFTSALLREVVHNGLLRRSRQAGHESIARWLEEREASCRGDLSGALAEHFEQGGDPASAFRWYRVAADRAESVFAATDAQRCLKRAIALAPEAGAASSREIAPLLNRLGDVLLREGHHAEARQAFLDALASRAPEDGALQRAELLRKIGKSWTLAQDLDRATEVLDGALEAAGPGPTAVKMAVLAEIGWVAYLRGRHEDAEASLQAGVALAGDVPATSADDVRARDRAEADLLSTLGAIASSRGHRADAVTLYEQARDLYWAASQKASAAEMDMRMGSARVAMGRADGALAPLQQALDVFEALGHRLGVAAAHNNLGRAHTRLGSFPEAEAHLALGRTAGEEAGSAARVAEACTWLAELSLDQRQTDRALMEARRAVAEADRSRLADVRAAARRVLARVHGVAGRDGDAIRAYQDVLAIIAPLGACEELATATQEYGVLCLERAGEGEERVERLRAGAAQLRLAVRTWRALGREAEAEEAAALLRRLVPLP